LTDDGDDDLISKMNNRSVLVSGLLLSLTGCAANEADFAVSAVAVPGDWVPPAATLARSNPQHVPVVDPPRITGSCMSTCPGNVWGACTDRGCSGLLPGTIELQRYIQGRWGYVGAGGNYSCRRNSNPASCDFLSVHSVGRAIDLMIPVVGGDADNTLGDAVANWLIENAEYIGIQRVIWDGKYWNGSRVNNHFSDISDALCSGRYCTDHHVNHIHAELSVDGANRRTRFFTAGPPPMTCPVVCYGTAAVRADCSFVDCAAMGQVCVPDPPRCAASEAPASVRNPGASIPAATRIGGLVRYRPVAPARLFDTRTPASSAQLQRSDGAMSGPLTGTRTGTFAAFPGVPADATGVWLNVTAVPQAAPGFISIYPAGSMTDSSSVNFAPPLARANASAMARGAGGGVTFRSNTDVDVITDMTGAFAPSGLGLRTTSPTRVVDTRGGAPVAANTRFTVTLNAPADTRGVVANVAVIPRGAPGFVQAFACDAGPPTTSNINHGPTAVVNNAVISTITGGQLCFQSLAEVDLIVDVNGYLVDNGELSLQLINPLRVMDTRNAGSIYTGRLGDGQIVEIPIAAIPGLPADARAALVNVTSTNASANGFVTAFPCGIGTPNASSLNYAANSVSGSAVVSALGTGRLCLFSNVRTHLIADLLGVWVPTPGSSPTDPMQPPPDQPEDPGMTEPDAGSSSDASAPMPDANAPAADSGPSRRDAAADGQIEGPPASLGCGCRAQPTHTKYGALALAALALAAVSRKRKR
jgi:MYXO-CTERM domain-containing protein